MNNDPLMPQSLDPSPAEEPTPTPAPTPAQRPSLVKHASLQPIHDDIVPEPLPPRPQPVAPQQPTTSEYVPSAIAASLDPNNAVGSTPTPTDSTPEVVAAPPAATTADATSPAIETQPIAQPPVATVPIAPPHPSSGQTYKLDNEVSDYEKRRDKKLNTWIAVIAIITMLPGLYVLYFATIVLINFGIQYALTYLITSLLSVSLGVLILLHKEVARILTVFLAYISIAVLVVSIIRMIINPIYMIYYLSSGLLGLNSALVTAGLLAYCVIVITFLQRKGVKALFR